jgi:hypothetical protein
MKNGGAVPPLSHAYSSHGPQLIKHRENPTFFAFAFQSRISSIQDLEVNAR